MSDSKKYATFRDLRSVSTPTAQPEDSAPSISSITSKPRTSSTGIAPEKDFQRVPNSITKQAIPSGVFRGKSKQVWDYLWSVSRGAIIPTRTVRKSRKEIKAGAGLGSMVTLDAAIDHLERVGLISIKPSVGSLLGNQYEIYTPEEASTRIPSISSISSPAQNVDNLDVPNSGTTRQTQVIENTVISEHSKTSFKTNTEQSDDDDAAARSLLRPIQKAVKAATGRELSRADIQSLTELGEILATEFQIAAARTTVNVPGAFLATHMRRRLFKKEKTQMLEELAAGDMPGTGAQELTAEELAKCPNCGGSGWWYPEGEGKGVAKCKHENLRREN